MLKYYSFTKIMYQFNNITYSSKNLQFNIGKSFSMIIQYGIIKGLLREIITSNTTRPRLLLAISFRGSGPSLLPPRQSRPYRLRLDCALQDEGLDPTTMQVSGQYCTYDCTMSCPNRVRRTLRESFMSWNIPSVFN